MRRHPSGSTWQAPCPPTRPGAPPSSSSASSRFDDPDSGLVLVTHEIGPCQTTLGIEVRQLRPLYNGPQYTQRRTGTDQGEGHCLNQEELEPCKADCDLAWAREALQWLRRHRLPPHME